ncbi:MAG: hypothetical protein AAF636_08390 [Pseudomonadota bacterium]
MVFQKFLLSFCLVAFAGTAFAEGQSFTSSDVLAWSAEGQRSFYLNSFGMAGIVAMQTGVHETHVACINDLLAENSETYLPVAEISSVLESYPDLHPQAVVMAIINRECGSFAVQ